MDMKRLLQPLDKPRLARGLLVLLTPVLVFAALALVVPGGESADAAATRHYYIAVDEVNWDYAPLNYNGITGLPFGEEENVFVQQGDNRIGHVYRKALYREYTDNTFTTLKPILPQWQHLGTLGPVIRAEVGDTIMVHFKNHASLPYSIHPHGVFYNKDSEGADYNDGTSGADKTDGAVPPGGTHTYVWQVPERAGPGPGDPSSILWMYHSHVNEPQDENGGLIGPMIISARGTTRPDGTPRDVDREFVLMFKIFDENDSHYLDYNIQTFTGQPRTVHTDDEEFIESNLMHSINGYVYGNLPGLAMRQGERVRWYVMGMGTEVDLHTAHWHAQTVLVNKMMRTDVVELLPASMKVADMVPDNPGIWLLHCHVNDHIKAGMLALFTVNP
jgi:FtsP/CotA-like multicopper oxidase with cupredoxin domain